VPYVRGIVLIYYLGAGAFLVLVVVVVVGTPEKGVRAGWARRAARLT
jgi:hypothetical protein